MVSPDGKFFFFTSYKTETELYSNQSRSAEELVKRFDSIQNGLGNVYWVYIIVLSLDYLMKNSK